ncbi:MAG: putative DNA modification/repair radical SAM protein [Treponema sp.]|jgi:putative DNA modification/repair radical SAM protein|nr:putative DNA modification/repair radical SAM protein [Treponema sp.]
MELTEKLSILSSSARYDASCASSGSGSPKGGDVAPKGAAAFGVRVPAGVCHSWTEDGRCVSLLKVLFSNVCRFDCAYCVNRSSADTQRTSFTVNELVELTCQFYRRNYIEGLFLSSGIFADPDIVMEKLIETARKLRSEAGYGGYLHLKIIPGAGEKMIRLAGLWADRLSANIELPTDKSLQHLAPQKTGKVILGAMEETFNAGAENEEDRRKFRLGGKNTVPVFAPAGQSTQLIVGASPETDKTILNLSSALYRKYTLRRVYYSAYIPVGIPGGSGIPDARLPEISSPPAAFGHSGPPRTLLTREHRLYQADWLLRFYKFSPGEILEGDEGFLDAGLDPKTAWALRHLDFFPVEVNSASYDELLRVPGIGAKTGRRIIETRRSRSLGFDALRRIGVVLKRARYFITAAGAFIERPEEPKRIRRLLYDEDLLQPLLFEF